MVKDQNAGIQVWPLVRVQPGSSILIWVFTPVPKPNTIEIWKKFVDAVKLQKTKQPLRLRTKKLIAETPGVVLVWRLTTKYVINVKMYAAVKRQSKNCGPEKTADGRLNI